MRIFRHLEKTSNICHYYCVDIIDKELHKRLQQHKPFQEDIKVENNEIRDENKYMVDDSFRF